MPDDSGAGQRAAGSGTPSSLDEFVVRVCVAAMWSDGAMATAERDALSTLVASVATSQHQRDRLRRIALEDVNRHQVLEEVEQLAPARRLDVFDRCVGMLISDRRVRPRELRFLGELRRRCGVGFWAYQRLRLRIAPRRILALSAAVLLALAVAAVLVPRIGSDRDIGPVETGRHPELLLPVASADAPELASDDLYQLVRRSVVEVHVLVDGRRVVGGSGAVLGVDQGGAFYIVTNRHVVDVGTRPGQTLRYEVEFENGARFDTLLDYLSRRSDLALLAVQGVPLWARPATLRLRRTLRVGEPVYALGSPLGLRHTFTGGVISALRSQHLQTDATVHSGSSGGPLFDAAGRLCGVVTSAHLAKDFSFALYADAVVEMLEDRRAAVVDEPTT